jgi:hydrogenase maturation protease
MSFGEDRDIRLVGYGNSARRDDGIGPYVAGRLEAVFKESRRIRAFSLHQLDPVLIDALRGADLIVFIDATVEPIPGGYAFSELSPQTRDFPCLTHPCTPSFLLGLMVSIHGKSPPAYMAAVQGDDFGHGEGLSAAALQRAERVVSEIANRCRYGGEEFG